MTYHRRPLSALLAIALVLNTLLSGCATSAPTTPEPIPTTPLDASGQPILKDVSGAAKVNVTDPSGWKVTVIKIGRVKTISQPGLVALEAKGVWLILQLTAANGSAEAGKVPRESFILKDSTGKEYKLDPTASDHFSIGAKLPNQGTVIAPKGSLQVGAVFDIDPAATGLKLKVGAQELAIQG